jgi:hypothetical protein
VLLQLKVARMLLISLLDILYFFIFCLCGVMVSVLAVGPKVHRFKPGQGDGFLKAINSAASLPLEEK